MAALCFFWGRVVWVASGPWGIDTDARYGTIIYARSTQGATNTQEIVQMIRITVIMHDASPGTAGVEGDLSAAKTYVHNWAIKQEKEEHQMVAAFLYDTETQFLYCYDVFNGGLIERTDP